jgi:hypothetical protein
MAFSAFSAFMQGLTRRQSLFQWGDSATSAFEPMVLARKT